VTGVSTSWTPAPADLFARLIDDAALFPPGNAPMTSAVPAHRAHREAPHAWLVGRFLCPSSRVDELRAVLDASNAAGARDDLALIELGLIADTGLDGLPDALAAVAADDRLALRAVEIRDPGADRVAELRAALPAGVLGYLELPPDAPVAATLDTLLGTPFAAKLRTGGLTAAAFPDVARVAEVLRGAHERGLALKCTAGLHQAVRHTNPATGFTHHGYLNILLAAAETAADADAATVRATLLSTDATALANACRRLAAPTARAARDLFVGYGSCSIDEPVHDLRALHLLEA
jgi:hypothetical protein